jgi:hemoglobin-like flavoprotein
MTPKQIELVENSWDFILANTTEAGLIFYNRLFELDPSLRALFKGDIKSQSQKLISLITFAVHKLNSLEEIMADVRALGVRHNKYRVQREHYATVAQALLWTLEKALGNQWTEELKTAWVTLYMALAKAMIEAAKEERVVI